jgi:hypothetical protein
MTCGPGLATRTRRRSPPARAPTLANVGLDLAQGNAGMALRLHQCGVTSPTSRCSSRERSAGIDGRDWVRTYVHERGHWQIEAAPANCSEALTEGHSRRSTLGIYSNTRATLVTVIT